MKREDPPHPPPQTLPVTIHPYSENQYTSTHHVESIKQQTTSKTDQCRKYGQY